MRPARWLLITVGIALAITAAIAAVPDFRFAYRNPPMHIALNTAEGVIALLVAFLMLGRFRQRCLMMDLLIVYSLAILGITNLALSLVPAIPAASTLDEVLTWAPLGIRTMGALGIAIAPWVSTVKLDNTGAWTTTALSAIVVTVAGITVLIWLQSDLLPAGVQTQGAITGGTGRPRFEGHPFLHALQLLQLLVYAAASVMFAALANATRDRIHQWFAVGAGLSAVARLNYVIFPSLYTEYVYVGDFMRLGFYLLLLAAAADEIQSYWETRAGFARLEERRRISRDLHDGLAQELVFIAAQTRRIAKHHEEHPEELGAAASAADRALAEARRAIDALTKKTDDPLDSVIRDVAEELTTRAEVRLEIETVPIKVTPEEREELVRIVREAITNAVRHGGASRIEVTLSNGEGLSLCISDDGTGFDPDVASEKKWSFGLQSMHERAARLNGTLVLTSAPGRGTTVEVRVPSNEA